MNGIVEDVDEREERRWEPGYARELRAYWWREERSVKPEWRVESVAGVREVRGASSVPLDPFGSCVGASFERFKKSKLNQTFELVWRASDSEAGARGTN